jgi:hypothetical protein
LEDNNVQAAPLSNDDKNKLSQLISLGFSEEQSRKVIQENPERSLVELLELL